jgi:cell division protein FtsZ
MTEGGAALMAVGRANGEDRARIAAEMAISSQLLDITIDGARGILFNITGGPSMTLFEVNTAAAIIKETAHPECNMIFGAVVDPTLGEELRITVIATGFDRAAPSPSLFDRAGVPATDQRTRKVEEAPNSSTQRPRSPEPARPERHERVEQPQQPAPRPTAQPQQPPTQGDFQRVSINTEDLDVPAFLRNRRAARNQDERH